MTTTKKVVCQKCKAIFKFDPSKITSEVVKFKCPRCSLVQIIRKPGPPEELSSSPPASLPEAITEPRMPGEAEPGMPEEAPQEAQSRMPGEAAPQMPEEAPQEAEPQPSEETAQEAEPRMPEEAPQEAESRMPEEAVAGNPELSRYADEEESRSDESKNDTESLEPSAADSEETLIKLLQAQAHNVQGETLIGKNLFNQAINDFSMALEIDPNYVEALINRGSTYAIMGMSDNALMDFTHALEFEKTNAEIYNKRGEIYLQNGMYDKAIKDFTSALILNPMFGAAYLNRGRAYSDKGMSDEAMMDYNQAIRTDFEHSSYNISNQAEPVFFIDEEKTGSEEESARFNQLGQADLENEKYEEALEKFTQAIHLSPNNAEGYINRATAYIKLLQPDKAMADFSKAVLLDPLNSSLYYWRAQAWQAKDDSFNMYEDLKCSCELGYEPACIEYRKFKPSRK